MGLSLHVPEVTTWPPLAEQRPLMAGLVGTRRSEVSDVQGGGILALHL